MIKLRYSWSRDYDPNRIIQDHSHPFYEFVYYRKGVGNTTIGGTTYNFDVGTFVLIPPYCVHNEVHEGLGSVYVIGFESDENIPLFFSNRENAKILDTVRNIKTEQRAKDPYFDKIIETEIRKILLLISRQESPNRKPALSQAIEKAILFVDEYYQSNIDLHELAKNSGYCEDHFRIMFKKTTGMNPKEYILNKKLIEAKRLLQDTNESIENISSKLGFSYCSRFSSFFKSRTGVYPKEYRKKSKQIDFA